LQNGYHLPTLHTVSQIYVPLPVAVSQYLQNVNAV